MTEALATATAPDPAAQLAAVAKSLAAVQDEAKVLLGKPDDRKALGQAAKDAYAHAGQGTQAGCQAAVADIAGVKAQVAKYGGDRKHDNARAVAGVLKAAGLRLVAIAAMDWGGNPPPPPPPPPPAGKTQVSIGQGFQTVRLHALAPIAQKVTVLRSGDTRAMVAIPVKVDPPGLVQATLDAAFFPGDTSADATVMFPALPASLRHERQAALQQMAGTLSLEPPAGVTATGTASFDFTVTDGEPPPGPTPPPPPPPSGEWPSGLPWRSGVTVPSNDPAMIADIRRFGQLRGRKVDVVNVKSLGTADWGGLQRSIAAKGPVYKALADDGIVVTQVVDYIPKQPGIGGNVLQQAGAGAFDNQWKQIANALKSYPKVGGFYAIRAGHELNGTFAWGPTADPDQRTFANYKASFARFAGIMRDIIPGVEIDWCWLRRGRPYRWDDVFPGKDAVTIVGLDPYDNEGQGGLKDDAAFQRYAYLTENGIPHGPGAAIEWAIAHGLKAGFAEWGLSTNMDDPVYIRGMFGLYKKYAASLAYEVFFNINAQKDHRLFDANPNATAEYKRLWTAGI